MSAGSRVEEQAPLDEEALRQEYNAGYEMLKKMGYVVGEGLGKGARAEGAAKTALHFARENAAQEDKPFRRTGAPPKRSTDVDMPDSSKVGN